MRTCPIGLFALFLSIALSPAAYADSDVNSPEVVSRRIPYALTLSGGVSLGAYEAGINWAILRYLKDTSRFGLAKAPVDNELIAVTGASAGAINALISALAWCMPSDVSDVDPKEFQDINPAIFRDTVGDNVLRDMWTGIGLEELLPSSPKANAYRSGDGLFTRNAFTKIFADLSNLIGVEKVDPVEFKKENTSAIELPLADGFSPPEQGRKVFRDGCQIHFGFTLTAEKARRLEVGGVSAPNQRYFVPLLLKIEGRRATFHRAALAPGLSGMGDLLVLPAKKDTKRAENVRVDSYEISNRSVLNLVLASSAFPVAFGRREVDHCVRPRPGAGQVMENRCPREYVPARDVFLDGGVFDNVPLGGTKSLAENGGIKPGRRVSYVFINPDNMRTPEEQSKGRQGQSLRYGLSYQVQFLGGAVDTARGHQLYSELDSGDWTRQLSILTRDFRQLAKLPAPSPSVTGLGARCEAIFNALKTKSHSSEEMGPQRLSDCLKYSADEYEAHLQKPTRNTELEKERTQALDRLVNVTKLMTRAAESEKSRKLFERFENRLKRASDDDGGDRHVMLSSRFFPVTGEYLGAFGAFFDEHFREYDYYVGIYDAVHGIARYICDTTSPGWEKKTQDDPEVGNCQGKVAQTLYHQPFGIGADPKGRHMFARLASMEHPGGIGGWNWIPAQDSLPENSPLDIVLDSICYLEASKDPITKEPTTRVVPVKEFEDFLRRLRARKYNPPNMSGQLASTLSGDDKIDTWWTNSAALVARRLDQLEQDTRASEKDCKEYEKLKGPCEEKKPHLDTASSRAANVAGWYDSGDKSPFDFVGTNGSHSAYLPHEYGSSVGDKLDLRSLYLSWEWRMRLLHNGLPVLVHVAPVQYFYEPEPVAVTRVGIRWHSSQKEWAFGGFNVKLIYGAGFDINRRWDANPVSGRRTALGISGFAEWGRFRATVGLRDAIWNTHEKFAQDHATGPAIAHAVPYLDIAYVLK